MFSLHDFILKTVLGMAEKEPEYKVREYALGWYQKGLLTQEDLAAVEAAFPEEAEEPEAPTVLEGI